MAIHRPPLADLSTTTGSPVDGSTAKDENSAGISNCTLSVMGFIKPIYIEYSRYQVK
jgi:hypothetical protein